MLFLCLSRACAHLAEACAWLCCTMSHNCLFAGAPLAYLVFNAQFVCQTSSRSSSAPPSTSSSFLSTVLLRFHTLSQTLRSGFSRHSNHLPIVSCLDPLLSLRSSVSCPPPFRRRLFSSSSQRKSCASVPAVCFVVGRASCLTCQASSG